MSTLAPLAVFIAALSQHRMRFVKADNLLCVPNITSCKDETADVQKYGSGRANYFCPVEAFAVDC